MFLELGYGFPGTFSETYSILYLVELHRVWDLESESSSADCLMKYRINKCSD